jgi:hypothetical protein
MMIGLDLVLARVLWASVGEPLFSLSIIWEAKRPKTLPPTGVELRFLIALGAWGCNGFVASTNPNGTSGHSCCEV